MLLTDARNDAGLERAIRRLPRGSALVFRHYHLANAARRRRFEELRRLAHGCGLLVIGSRVPASWYTDGTYGAADEVAGKPGLRLATAHSLREIAMAAREGADAVLLSPVFATRSHPGAAALGTVRFLLLARRSPLPVIALGGMTRARAVRLPVAGWAAIDGLA
ncbi:thiamine phosphate synthase [Novosphingobium sp. 17-62-19]|uniref:thiamine phosphate synthase n=1 Tax=Novosphingobium sp. 17-62-19 TaxID=1970406 RepID=UPI00344DFE8E